MYFRKVTFYRPLIVPYPSAWHEGMAPITWTKNAREREINERDGVEFDFLRFCVAGKYACNDERVMKERRREKNTSAIYFVIIAIEWSFD